MHVVIHLILKMPPEFVRIHQNVSPYICLHLIFSFFNFMNVCSTMSRIQALFFRLQILSDIILAGVLLAQQVCEKCKNTAAGFTSQ